MGKPTNISPDMHARYASLPEELQGRISQAFVPADRSTIPEEIRSKLTHRPPAGTENQKQPTEGHIAIFRDVPAPVTDDAAVTAAAGD